MVSTPGIPSPHSALARFRSLQLRQEFVFACHIEFSVIHIREAHPVDAWDVGSENRIHGPQTIVEGH